METSFTVLVQPTIEMICMQEDQCNDKQDTQSEGSHLPQQQLQQHWQPLSPSAAPQSKPDARSTAQPPEGLAVHAVLSKPRFDSQLLT